MKSGIVKWFNDNKGYGFIQQDGGGDDVFVHFSTIKCLGFKSLVEGERIFFEYEPKANGPQATMVITTREIEKITNLIDQGVLKTA
jgi:CspA family cold shock protein